MSKPWYRRNGVKHPAEVSVPITIYAVKFVDVLNDTVTDPVFTHSRQQAVDYARNKGKTSGGKLVGRVYRLTCKIEDEAMVDFTIGQGSNSL